MSWKCVVRTAFDMLMQAQFQESLGMKLILREQHEPELTHRIKESLRRGDGFIDVGANIGYYTLLASKLVGEDGLVLAFEPSPPNLARLADNLMLNRCNNVLLFSEALSDAGTDARLSLPWHINSGVASLGNGPSSNGEACFASGYTLTATTRLDDVLASLSISRPMRVVKIDAEGHEARILLSTQGEDWLRTDAMLEIGSAKNAAAIFEHCDRLGVRIFTQKTGWRRARRLAELPTSYREGSAFLTRREIMPGMGP